VIDDSAAQMMLEDDHRQVYGGFDPANPAHTSPHTPFLRNPDIDFTAPTEAWIEEVERELGWEAFWK